LKGQEFKTVRTGNKIKGTWGALTYSFEVTRVLAKPLATTDDDEAQSCNLRGTKVMVFYRDKSGVNLSALASKVSDKLRSTGADIEVQKGNEKDRSEQVVFYNGQNPIAGRIAECVREEVLLTTADGGPNYLQPNIFQIYLQTLSSSVSAMPASGKKTK
jgi:hypothetical protein